MKRVFLIDSMSHIFRAFFAPMGAKQEPLRNSKGQVTQAIFVFTNMLRKLLNDERPDYIAAVFDTDEPTFRHASFADYKANREAMPADLAAQIPFIVRVCEAFNIPILRYDGYEADDIIGTFAKKAADRGLKAVIVSNDKDLCQLVKDPHIVAMRQNAQNVRRKVPVPAVEWCDEAWVLNKFGVPPDKIIDLLGLMGDAVDNIPGAPGIGEKGAVKLVQEFGSAEAAMENAEKVTHKTYRESLLNNRDLIRQSIELATVHCEVPIEFELEKLKYREPDRKLAYELFRELEFTALTREFSDAKPLFDMYGDARSDAVQRKYSEIKDKAEFDKLVRRLFEAEQFSVYLDEKDDSDKISVYARTLPNGVAIAAAPGESYYINISEFAEGPEIGIKAVGELLSNGFMSKTAFDSKRAFGCFHPACVTPEGFTDDVLIAAYLLDSTRASYDLEFLAQAYLDIEMAGSPDDGSISETAFGAAEKADIILRLTPVLRSKLADAAMLKLYTDIELPLVPVIAGIEMAGMKVDVDKLKKFSDFISAELEVLKKKIFEIAGREFNIGSPKQVGEVFEHLNISTGRKTATGQISTSKDVLAELALTYEIAQLIIDYRELDKLKATYADSLPKMVSPDGRIHGVLNQTVAATGRLSSTEPNLQNIPNRTELGRQIRAAFIPEKGNKLLSADYSQLELRILADITGDEVMLAAFRNGEDIHANTARLVFDAKDEKELKEKRRLAKIVNFGIAYAVEAFGLAQRVGISRQEARKVIDDYFETYKGIRKYMDETPETARRQGYISSLFGRRRFFPSINDRNFTVRSRSEREAINMPIQGTASDIVKIAMLNVDAALKKGGFKTQTLMQVHDELLFEVPENEIESVREVIKEAMESAAQLKVPLIVEVGVGDNWITAK